jgi:hypothetical protein
LVVLRAVQSPQVEQAPNKPLRLQKPQASNPGLLLKLHEYKRMRRPVRLRYKLNLPKKPPVFSLKRLFVRLNFKLNPLERFLPHK